MADNVDWAAMGSDEMLESNNCKEDKVEDCEGKWRILRNSELEKGISIKCGE